MTVTAMRGGPGQRLPVGAQQQTGGHPAPRQDSYRTDGFTQLQVRAGRPPQSAAAMLPARSDRARAYRRVSA